MENGGWFIKSLQASALRDRIPQLKFDCLSIGIITDQFPGGRSYQNFPRLCQVVRNAQFDKRCTGNQEFPAIEHSPYMDCADLTQADSQLEIEVGILSLVIAEALMYFEGAFCSAHGPLPLVRP